MKVENIQYDIEDLNVIRLVRVDGNVIADFTPSTGIINQHNLEEYPLPDQVIEKLTEE